MLTVCSKQASCMLQACTAGITCCLLAAWRGVSISKGCALPTRLDMPVRNVSVALSTPGSKGPAYEKKHQVLGKASSRW